MVPGPEFVKQLNRDEQAIRELAEDSSLTNQIRVMKKHGITYDYLKEIWRTLGNRSLESPYRGPARSQAMDEAVRHYKLAPDTLTQIVDVWNLNANERLRVMKMATRP